MLPLVDLHRLLLPKDYWHDVSIVGPDFLDLIANYSNTVGILRLSMVQKELVCAFWFWPTLSVFPYV